MENENKEKVDIIDYYDDLCLDIIDNMESVKQFKEDFHERVDVIYRFKASTSSLYKLLHPIKLIKYKKEKKILNEIYDKFSEIYDRSVIKFVKEETGDLKEDLETPTFKTKPNEIDTYVKSLKLKK